MELEQLTKDEEKLIVRRKRAISLDVKTRSKEYKIALSLLEKGIVLLSTKDNKIHSVYLTRKGGEIYQYLQNGSIRLQ